MTTSEVIEIEPGYVITKETTEIIDGVTLIVIDGKEGTLEIGVASIDFDFTLEAEHLFANLDTHGEIIELLAILATLTPSNYK